MDKVIEKNLCTGCNACKCCCPKDAIVMVFDQDGFQYPVIDSKKCINCGLCKKTCPVLNCHKKDSTNLCYVAYNKNQKEQKKSSSGGIFSAIAKDILKDGGVVIGAAFVKNFSLKHVVIEQEQDLKKLRGSKYLQSDLENIFEYIKTHVKERKILFVGLPCQVAGLKMFLKKEYENLICIDLICHGVPSVKLFQKYVRELEVKYDTQLLHYDFRDKSTGWDSYSNTATFKSKKISQLQKDNSYMRLFLSDIALRESCYCCQFKLGNKYSDITLGDFWGVKNYYPEMYHKDGVSAVIIHSSKGNQVFERVANSFVFKPCKLEEITAGNPSLKCSASKPKGRESFFTDLDNLTVDVLAKKYSKKTSLLKRIVRKIKNIGR